MIGSFLNQLLLLPSMEGMITSFRRGRRTISHNQMILKVRGVNSKEKAQSLVGKKAAWKSPAGKEITGTITAAHGGKGCVRAAFETGMPGQSIGTKISIQ
jgi:large subunit ribosomal protein L35Ae